jgi:hypothetical protein
VVALLSSFFCDNTNGYSFLILSFVDACMAHTNSDFSRLCVVPCIENYKLNFTPIIDYTMRGERGFTDSISQEHNN